MTNDLKTSKTQSGIWLTVKEQKNSARQVTCKHQKLKMADTSKWYYSEWQMNWTSETQNRRWLEHIINSDIWLTVKEQNNSARQVTCKHQKLRMADISTWQISWKHFILLRMTNESQENRNTEWQVTWTHQKIRMADTSKWHDRCLDNITTHNDKWIEKRNTEWQRFKTQNNKWLEKGQKLRMTYGRVSASGSSTRCWQKPRKQTNGESSVDMWNQVKIHQHHWGNFNWHMWEFDFPTISCLL